MIEFASVQSSVTVGLGNKPESVDSLQPTVTSKLSQTNTGGLLVIVMVWTQVLVKPHSSVAVQVLVNVPESPQSAKPDSSSTNVN